MLGINLGAFWVIIKQPYEAETIIILMIDKETKAEKGQVACPRSQSL